MWMEDTVTRSFHAVWPTVNSRLCLSNARCVPTAMSRSGGHMYCNLMIHRTGVWSVRSRSGKRVLCCSARPNQPPVEVNSYCKVTFTSKPTANGATEAQFLSRRSHFNIHVIKDKTHQQFNTSFTLRRRSRRDKLSHELVKKHVWWFGIIYE